MPLGAFKAALIGTAGVSTASVVLLSTTTASNAATVSITSGIDSTYGEYIFKLYNINPATNDSNCTFQVSSDGGSSYGVAITSAALAAIHTEADGEASLFNATGQDLSQSTSYQQIGNEQSNDADSGGCGELHLFNPSSTTYAKHFMLRFGFMDDAYSASGIKDSVISGYINSTSAVNAIQFKMSSGNFDGKIKMWGIK